MYIHTGILEFTKAQRVNRHKPKPITRIPIDEQHALERIEGVWYATVFIPNIYYHPYDSFCKDREPYTIMKKEQLSRKELRIHGLRNEAEVS